MSDKWIKKMVSDKQMITPFESDQIRKGGISYGVSSYGYDEEFLIILKYLQMLTQLLWIQKIFQIKVLLIEKQMFVLYHQIVLL